ncbi:MAG TPA: antitoxin Xre/MbcA/ParS toxin-binding domain-containing protein [Caulobacteraceae bacterium]|nr:antitoxin Xre/MbcA/ParS toxin-binding domain-containing protein [Caulobacteraceae bacterium]
MTAVARIQELLGGEANTGPIRTDLDVVRLVRRGVPTRAVDHFLRASHLTFEAIEGHVMARRTFKRRQDAAQPLDPGESDRLVRLVRIVAAAEDTFGDSQKALTWLGRANRALDGLTPLSLADTDLGARSVETLLGRIGHGIAA